MSRNPASLWVTIAVLASACGCILGNGSGSAPAADAPIAPSAGSGAAAAAPQGSPAKARAKADANGARVQAAWQTKLTALVEAPDGAAAEAWGLFSEGGWSDAGQVMVLAGKPPAPARLLVVSPGKKDFAVDRPLTADEWQRVVAQSKAAAPLGDVDITMFDGIVFEYVHMVRSANGKATADKRIYIRNPGNQALPPHDALVATFQSLRKQP